MPEKEAGNLEDAKLLQHGDPSAVVRGANLESLDTTPFSLLHEKAFALDGVTYTVSF